MTLDDETYLEEKLLPVFKNFLFSGYDAFKVGIYESKADARFFTVIYLHGCLYRQICFALGEQLSGAQYKFYFDNDVSERFEDDSRIFSFRGTDFAKISYYYEGERIGELVYPLLAACIEADLKQGQK